MDIMTFALICGAVGVAYGLFTTTWVLKQDAGNPRMQEISAAVREGANAFLNRQYKTVAMVGAVVFVLLFALGKYTAIGFVIGAVGSALAGYVGMYVSVRANVRTAQAAFTSMAHALKVSFRGGSVTGMLVVGLALLSVAGYYYNRENETSNNSNREVKLTDSGRTVYGGGGITPDVVVPPIKSNHFQDTLLQHYAFFNFAKRYVVNHHPTKGFEVDDATLQEFRKSLDEANIAYTQADLIDNNDWLKSNVKAEIFVDAFGQDEGMKVRTESDPEVIKGLELLPQAKALADNAKKIVAEHNAAPAFNR